MLLEGKNAVVYGGGGKVGAAVARAFASLSQSSLGLRSVWTASA